MMCTPHKYYSCYEMEKNKMSSACSTYGERRDAYRVLVGRAEVNKQLGRSRLRWDDNITIDPQLVGWKHGMD